MGNASESEEKHPGKEGKSWTRHIEASSGVGKHTVGRCTVGEILNMVEPRGRETEREKEAAGRRLGRWHRYQGRGGAELARNLEKLGLQGTEMGQNKYPWEGMRFLRQNKLKGTTEVRRKGPVGK